MTAVLPRTRPAPSPEPRAVPPRRTPDLPEPVGRRARYWDHQAAGWRPGPGASGC